MSAIVTDTKNLVNQELVPYVVIAVVLCCIVLAVTMDSFVIPVLFMLSIGMAIIYNLGTNVFKGEISFITMSLVAVLQLGVTMDYSIFLWGSYKEQRETIADKNEAMAHAIAATIAEALKCKEEGVSRTILFNLSGHGLIDMSAYDQYLRGELTNFEYTPAPNL
mgnify:CR=1 FL=1